MVRSPIKVNSTNPIWYELRNAVLQRNFSTAQSLVSEHPEIRALRNGIGETVLHYLAVENDIDGIKWLYNKGFGINVKNDFGTPVVFEVAQLNYKELVLWFISNGVDMAAVNNESQDIAAYLQEYANEEIVEFVQAQLP